MRDAASVRGSRPTDRQHDLSRRECWVYPYVERVVQLAEDLTRDNVPMILDQWVVREG